MTAEEYIKTLKNAIIRVTRRANSTFMTYLKIVVEKDMTALIPVTCCAILTAIPS